MDDGDLSLQLRGMLQLMEQLTTDIGRLQNRQQNLQLEVEQLIDAGKADEREKFLIAAKQIESGRVALEHTLASMPVPPPPPMAESTGGLFSTGSLASIARDRTTVSAEDEEKYLSRIKSGSLSSR
eukprot:TRINITY_DN16837_c0_g1_i1.p1 TRINITY_DN16837_c0_g1~~TRINITY_DN16837_c0_g1_i1.p1  ORF type:complete len:148 (+),score=34.51 TRINITY_DN16837_c0_g1_i1:68-445(+)